MAKPRVTNLDHLFSEGESELLEFKSSIPKPDNLARLISSFANSKKGGTIVLGLDDRKTRILSVDEKKAEQFLDKAVGLLTPKPEIKSYPLNSIRGKLFCIDVNPSKKGPVAAEGVFLRRVGSTNQLMSRNDLKDMFQDGSESDNDIDLLATQSKKLDEIRQHQLESRSWKRRAPDLLLGALAGAILSVIFTAIFL